MDCARTPPLRYRDIRPVTLRRQRTAVCLLLLSAVLAIPTAAPPADVHFSPDGGIRRHLLRAIQESKQRIDVAVYHMTAAELAEALVAARHRGVQVRVVTDQEKARANGPAMRVLRAGGVAVRSLGVADKSLMHHKFAVFDDRLVATGSYNWTNTAERANYESVVLLDEAEAVGAFLREFQRLWRAAKE